MITAQRVVGAAQKHQKAPAAAAPNPGGGGALRDMFFCGFLELFIYQCSVWGRGRRHLNPSLPAAPHFPGEGASKS